ncbi:hypothetical protein HK102_002905, partial [Quaeritorhiza haematococci]
MAKNRGSFGDPASGASPSPLGASNPSTPLSASAASTANGISSNQANYAPLTGSGGGSGKATQNGDDGWVPNSPSSTPSAPTRRGSDYYSKLVGSPSRVVSPSTTTSQRRVPSISRHNSGTNLPDLAATAAASVRSPTMAARTNSSSNILAPTPAQSTSVHPPLENVEELEKYIEHEPSNVVQILPAFEQLVERFCLAHPDTCLEMWTRLKPIIQDINSRTRRRASHHNSTAFQRPPSPICSAKPYKFVNVHDEEWEDDYAWLNDKENEEVLNYIEAENNYAKKMLSHTKPLQKILYKEFVSRLDEGEESAKVTLPDGYSYFTRKIPGEEYRIHCRVDGNGVEEIYLDQNELANSPEFADASYFRVGFLKHSPNCKLIAYGVDSSGNERYTTFFMDMETKQVLEDRIEGVYEDFEFSNESQYVYYTLLDDCERAYQLKRHKIGTDVSHDEVLYHEEDEMFYLSLTKSSNSQFIILNSAAQITSETRYISANNPTDPPHLLIPRRENIQYTCENHDKHFYILTNEESKNNWLFRVPIPSSLETPPESWEQLLELRETVIEHRDFVLIEDFQLRRNHLIVFERSNCLQNVRIVDLTVPGFSTYHYVSFSEMVYSLWPGSVNEEVADLIKSTQFDTNVLRFTYTSLVQPKQVVDYDMDTRTMTVVHEEKVGGIIPYDPSMYTSKRLFATGVDGTTVPVSLVYRRDLLGMNMNPPQPNPLLLHGYGAYGAPVNPIFSTSRLSLLDRGFIYAVAHVRGGADMGNGWYEEGKLHKKPNTFLDFISVAEYLCKEGYTNPSKLAIYGRSAGGLLIGACINMRPDLFRAALTEVPFVDVINTMFDSSIPWTAFEWEEWGNPNDPEIYAAMKTYCPYTNIRGEALAKQEYPHLLVVGGMNDPRVAFFEPLKLVAKMRGEKRKYLKMMRERRATLAGSAAGILSKEDLASECINDQMISASNLLDEGDDTIVMKHDPEATSGRDQSPPPKAERLLLLRVDDVGHGGNSGQYSYLEDLAFEYAFLISTLQASTKPLYSGVLSTAAAGSLNGSFDANNPLSPMGSPMLYSQAQWGLQGGPYGVGMGGALYNGIVSPRADEYDEDDYSDSEEEDVKAGSAADVDRGRSNVRGRGPRRNDSEGVHGEVGGDMDDGAHRKETSNGGRSSAGGKDHKKRRGKDDMEEKEYRNKTKGDRGQNRL